MHSSGAHSCPLLFSFFLVSSSIFNRLTSVLFSVSKRNTNKGICNNNQCANNVPNIGPRDEQVKSFFDLTYFGDDSWLAHLWSDQTCHGSSSDPSPSATEYADNIHGQNPQAVHILGELSFTCAMVVLLRALNISCIAFTTHRNVVDDADSKKIVTFSFVQFREY